MTSPTCLARRASGTRLSGMRIQAKPAGGPWPKHVIDSVTVAPTHGHPVDLDGDGDLDVVMAFGLAAGVANNAPESHQIAWYENVGKPGTGAEWRKHQIAANFPQGF